MLCPYGPIIALLTPFDARGNIDWPAFKSYLEALYSWGVRSVIANGTTGEFPSLTLPERQRTVEFVRKHFQGAVINNVSSTCIKDARKLIEGTQGYGDAVLMLPPYYYAAVRNEGLYAFFGKVLSGNSLPVFLYNFPQHSGNKVDHKLVAMLLDKGIRIAGIKDSGGDLQNALACRSRFPELLVWYASDSEALAALRQGLAGSVTGGANPLPEFLLAIGKTYAAGGDTARTLQRGFDVWNTFRAKHELFEIPLVKAAMGARIGDFPIHVRPPFTPAPAEALSRIRTTVSECLSELKTMLG